MATSNNPSAPVSPNTSTSIPLSSSAASAFPLDTILSQQQQQQQPPASAAAGPRRSSFGFLRRKSTTESGSNQRRTPSGAKISKKQKVDQDEAMRRHRQQVQAAPALPTQPPRLPSHSPLPTMDHFGGVGASNPDFRPDSVAIVSNRAHSMKFSRPAVDASSARDTSSSAAAAAHAAIPIPPIPTTSYPAASYMDHDPYPRTESMTHRGRFSYASSAISAAGVISPRRVRRRKDPTPFNILVVGSKGSGKSSFIDFLRTALRLPAMRAAAEPVGHPNGASSDATFTSEYLETEFENERVGVTLWDSQGLEKNIADFQLPVITAFLESKFEDTFTEEQKVVRAPGVRDTHIHCVFLILDPARLDANMAESRKKANAKGISYYNNNPGALDEELDLNVLRELQGKTTVIPVISKADSITVAHMRYLKKAVWDTLKKSKLDPLEPLHLTESDDEEEEEEDNDEVADVPDMREEDSHVRSDVVRPESEVLGAIALRSSSEVARSNVSSPPSSPNEDVLASSSPNAKFGHTRKPSSMSATLQSDDSGIPYLPFSIISPDPYDPSVVGRKFPWGFADPYNAEHCDFLKLRESVFKEWRAELREVSREQWYEGWRTTRLQVNPNRRKTALTDGHANGRVASTSNRDYRQHRSAGI